MLNGKSLTDFTNLFLPNSFKRNDDITLNFLKNGYECHSFKEGKK